MVSFVMMFGTRVLSVVNFKEGVRAQYLAHIQEVLLALAGEVLLKK